MIGFGLTVTSAPASEPITLAEAKTALRIDHSEWDDEIEGVWLPAAREEIERRLSVKLVTQTVKVTLDRFPSLGIVGFDDQDRLRVVPAEQIIAGQIAAGVIEIPVESVASISSVKYYDTDNTLQTISSSNYQVDTARTPCRIAPVLGYAWPATRAKLAAVEIVAVVGAAAASVSPMLKAALILTLRARYEENDTLQPTIDRLLDLAWDGVRHGPKV